MWWRPPGCITPVTTRRDTGATRPPSTSWRTCSRPTSPKASMPSTTTARSSGGRRIGPVSSRSPAATAGPPTAGRAGLRGRGHRPRAHRLPHPHPLRERHGGHGAGRAARSARRDPAHIVAVARGQGHRPGLPARDPRLGRIRGIRPVVPLEGRRQRHAPALGWAAEDGTLGRIVLGMDAARQGYWSAYGGSPGMAWLLGSFSSRDARARLRGCGAATSCS